jgi:hypothetical protein
MICPHCNNNIDDSYEVCPSCGGGVYEQYNNPDNVQYFPEDQANEQYQNPPFDDSLPAEGYDYNVEDSYSPDNSYENSYPPDDSYDNSYPPEDEEQFRDAPQNTSIVALDPEFQKGTRIVANPMLTDSSRQRVRKRVAVTEDIPLDDLGKLIYDIKYVFGRMNLLEKLCLWFFLITILMSFAPWIVISKYSTWVSGYESAGLWVAISAVTAIILLMFRIGMRLGGWAAFAHIIASFATASIPLYLFLRKPLAGQQFMVPFFLTFGLAVLGFIFAFSGTIRRFMK